jgi:putative SOS response-associated peptidase YedK
MTRAPDEIAHLFDAIAEQPSNAGGEVYPGYPGYVVAEGRVRTMNWGFPLAMQGKTGQPLKPKPINNARTDKLEGGFWRPSFEKRRCVIPVEAFAEAEGPKGAKTRTWISLPDQDVFAVAGIWRWSEEWGEVYSMVMTEACVHMDNIHDRMPVILEPDRVDLWLHGSREEALSLCVPYAGLLSIERTRDPWVRRTPAA